MSIRASVVRLIYEGADDSGTPGPFSATLATIRASWPPGGRLENWATEPNKQSLYICMRIHRMGEQYGVHLERPQQAQCSGLASHATWRRWAVGLALERARCRRAVGGLLPCLDSDCRDRLACPCSCSEAHPRRLKCLR